MPVGGRLESLVGPRLCAYAAVLCLSLGTFLSSLSSSVSTLAAAQFLYGMGIGLGYIAPLTCGYKHLPDRKGLVSGVIVGGFGAGSFIFNFVVTAFVNPDDETLPKCDDDAVGDDCVPDYYSGGR